jgi:protein-ribulosamine 3-kinase
VLAAELPEGTQATGISAFGASFWTRTARLDTEKDGEAKAYLLKVNLTQLLVHA